MELVKILLQQFHLHVLNIHFPNFREKYIYIGLEFFWKAFYCEIFFFTELILSISAFILRPLKM